VPDIGRATHEQYRIQIPASRTEYPSLPWKCANTTMLNVYFEIRKERHLDYLLSEYSRTSPAYCRLSVFDVGESPIGPFRDAYLGLGCRMSMMPAVLVAASITDNPRAMAAGIAERGFPNTLGKIEFAADRTQARALISDRQGPLLEVTLPTLQTMEPGRLAFDHADGVITREDGTLQLVATSAEMEIRQAALCKNGSIEYPIERDSVWQILNCRQTVSAQLIRGVRTFSAGKQPE
jgi:hypothetical protein